MTAPFLSEFLPHGQDRARERVGIMADIPSRLQQRERAHGNAQLLDIRAVQLELGHALFCVRLHDLRRDRRAVCDADVDDAGAGMLQNGADMIVGVVAVGLTVLGHDVQRVDLACTALADGVSDAADKEIRNDARIEAPRPDHDDIGVADGLHALRQGRRTLWDQPDLADAGIVDLFRVEDLALTEHAAAVVKLRLQPHILIGHGQHPAGDGQDVPHPVDRLVKRAGNAVHGRQEQIAEALPREATLGEAVVQQLAHRLFRVGQRQNAAPDVAGRQHAEILAQRAGASVRVGEYGETVFFFHI